MYNSLSRDGRVVSKAKTTPYAAASKRAHAEKSGTLSEWKNYYYNAFQGSRAQKQNPTGPGVKRPAENGEHKDSDQRRQPHPPHKPPRIKYETSAEYTKRLRQVIDKDPWAGYDTTDILYDEHWAYLDAMRNREAGKIVRTIDGPLIAIENQVNLMDEHNLWREEMPEWLQESAFALDDLGEAPFKPWNPDSGLSHDKWDAQQTRDADRMKEEAKEIKRSVFQMIRESADGNGYERAKWWFKFGRPSDTPTYKRLLTELVRDNPSVFVWHDKLAHLNYNEEMRKNRNCDILWTPGTTEFRATKPLFGGAILFEGKRDLPAHKVEIDVKEGSVIHRVNPFSTSWNMNSSAWFMRDEATQKRGVMFVHHVSETNPPRGINIQPIVNGYYHECEILVQPGVKITCYEEDEWELECIDRHDHVSRVWKEKVRVIHTILEAEELPPPISADVTSTPISIAVGPMQIDAIEHEEGTEEEEAVRIFNDFYYEWQTFLHGPVKSKISETFTFLRDEMPYTSLEISVPNNCVSNEGVLHPVVGTIVQVEGEMKRHLPRIQFQLFRFVDTIEVNGMTKPFSSQIEDVYGYTRKESGSSEWVLEKDTWEARPPSKDTEWIHRLEEDEKEYEQEDTTSHVGKKKTYKTIKRLN